VAVIAIHVDQDFGDAAADRVARLLYAAPPMRKNLTRAGQLDVALGFIGVITVDLQRWRTSARRVSQQKRTPTVWLSPGRA